MAKNKSLPIDSIQVSAVVVACLVLVGCAPGSSQPVEVSDWCWLHYRLAPPGALASDAGPGSIAEAAAWSTWLGSTADVPAERRNAHRTQRRLLNDLVESGAWSDDARERYDTAAHTEPTPATVCETVGARIAVADDGSVPAGWDERFLDPNDPAYSVLAVAGLGR